jgi:hypothetical protein
LIDEFDTTGVDDIAGTHPKFFVGGGGGVADIEAVYNLCLILKIMV